MSTLWKVVVCVTALVAALGLGLAAATWMGLDAEIAQSDPDAPIYVDLTQLMLKYDDPMRNMSGYITYRNVFQDALWWQIMDPHASEENRMECFLMVGMLAEGRGVEITQAQYDILMGAVQQVWGPAVVAAVEEELQ